MHTRCQVSTVRARSLNRAISQARPNLWQRSKKSWRRQRRVRQRNLMKSKSSQPKSQSCEQPPTSTIRSLRVCAIAFVCFERTRAREKESVWDDNDYAHDFSQSLSISFFLSSSLPFSYWSAGPDIWGNVTFSFCMFRARALTLCFSLSLFLSSSFPLSHWSAPLDIWRYVLRLPLDFYFVVFRPLSLSAARWHLRSILYVTVEYATLELTCRMCVCARERVLGYFTAHESCEKWMKCVTNRVCATYVTIRSWVPCCVCASVYEGIYHIWFIISSINGARHRRITQVVICIAIQRCVSLCASVCVCLCICHILLIISHINAFHISMGHVTDRARR